MRHSDRVARRTATRGQHHGMSRQSPRSKEIEQMGQRFPAFGLFSTLHFCNMKALNAAFSKGGFYCSKNKQGRLHESKRRSQSDSISPWAKRCSGECMTSDMTTKVTKRQRLRALQVWYHRDSNLGHTDFQSVAHQLSYGTSNRRAKISRRIASASKLGCFF